MKRFRETWKAGPKWKAVADELGCIGKCLNNLVGGYGINVVPNSKGGFNIEGTIREEVAASTLRFSFKCSLTTRDPVAPETEPVLQVIVASGYRQVIGAAPVAVNATAFDAGTSGSVYMVWTYTTDSTPGSWKDFSGDPMAYGTAETEDETKRVVILATYASGVLTQRHLGDVAVMDIIDRTACS